MKFLKVSNILRRKIISEYEYCDEGDSTHHCWHDAGAESNPITLPVFKEVCCHCGKEKYVACDPWYNRPQHHGKYLPKGK